MEEWMIIFYIFLFVSRGCFVNMDFDGDND